MVRYRNWPGTCLGSTIDINEISRIAQSIATSGEFANPYGSPTGPTAHHAPVFPFLVSFVYHLPPDARTPARAGLNIVFGSILCALVYFTGLALGIRKPASLVAALILALVPPSLAVELCNDQEATLVGVLTVSAVGVTALWLRRSFKSNWLVGWFWGFVLLTAPGLALVYSGALLLATTVPGLGRQVPFLILLTAIVLAPWIIRNRLALGGWFFVRDNLGLELRVSNADDAAVDPSMNAERGAMQDFHPLFNRAAADMVRKEGELVVYSRYGRDAGAWIETHPSRFLALSWERFRFFWWPVEGSWRQLVGRTAALLLAAVGLVLLFRRERVSALLLINLFVLYPLVYYFVQSYARYRFPIEWAIILLAVFALIEPVKRLSLAKDV